MRVTRILLLPLANCTKLITHINIPACRNCIYYKPNSDMFNNDFTGPNSCCEKFGVKDIITDKIMYNTADWCRRHDNLCGTDGKYFEKEPNIDNKIMVHKISSTLSMGFIPIISGIVIGMILVKL